MFDKSMQAALAADGEKLRAMTGEDHGPYFDYGDEQDPAGRIEAAIETRSAQAPTYAIAHGSAAVQAARIIAGVATARDNDKAEAMLSEVAALVASWRAGHVKSVSVMARLDRMFPGSPSVTTPHYDTTTL